MDNESQEVKVEDSDSHYNITTDLQNKILIVSLANLMTLTLLLFVIFTELGTVITSWIEQNIQGQDFDEFDTEENSA